jgi:threonine aldolase
MAVDLRSDTVTRPSAEMRRAMADAEVGDDVYGEDPTAKRLEARVAELLDKEAALFVPSGTMANQIALLLHCRRGDSVIVSEGTHCMRYETGASAAWSGVQFSVVGDAGMLSPDAVDGAIATPDAHESETRLVVIENTHNHAGGRVLPLSIMRAVAEVAHRAGLSVHLDGARLWNAGAASGAPVDAFAAHADTVSVCFSKGLGAPVGSAIVGTRDAIRQARRLRKMLGGGMRQVGVVCAAALFALEHHRDRLAEDHALAKYFAERAAGLPSVVLDPTRVETNIVNVDLAGVDARTLVQRLRERSVWVNAVSASRIRVVTHRDVTRADVDVALEELSRAL